MPFAGIEEIFLDVQDLDRALDFYHHRLGIPIATRTDSRVYLQLEASHIVLQLPGSGRHRGGGPMHFAMTVDEDTFDRVVEAVSDGSLFIRGPMGERGKGRALFMLDPDGNETEVNTRYLYGTPQR